MADEIRFYLDEHIAKAVARGLRQRGIDALTAHEAGLIGASDEEHMRRASNEGRVMVTQDEDFLRIHAEGCGHAGIAYAAQHTPIGEIISGLMLIHQIIDPDEMLNHVEFL